MNTTEKEKSKTLRKNKKIPEALIYEVIDGKTLYYKGYQDVLSGKKTFEEIMGSSTLQAVLIHYLNSILFKELDLDTYYILSNESGLHINHRNNMANDIAIYEASILTPDKINKKYATVPPLLAIEIDIKADLSNEKDFQYVNRKTKRLLEFGVEKVIWVFSDTQIVLVALQDEDWLSINWDKDIELIKGIEFNIGNYLKKKGIKIEDEI